MVEELEWKEKTTVSVRLTPDEMDMMEMICRKTCTTRSSVIKRAFHVLCEQEKIKGKEAREEGLVE